MSAIVIFLITLFFDFLKSKISNKERDLTRISWSYETLFHKLQYKNFILDLHHGNEHLNHLLQPSRLQRAIGVIYSPETERLSHYFFTRLPYQFDALIHIDKTNAIRALDKE